MRLRLRTGSVAVLLLLGVCPSCSKRNLEIGTGAIDIDAGGNDLDATAPRNDAGGPRTDGAGGVTGLDAQQSACVTTTILLPWTASASTTLRLDVATTAGAVAAINRQLKQTDVRTFKHDGSVISGFQFGADAQFLPYDDSRFLLLARGTTGDFVATAIDPDLVAGTRLYTATANATEHMLGAIVLSRTAIVLITDEHFVNVATGDIVPWSTVLGAADRDTFKSGRIYGMAARSDRILVAWGANDGLRLAVLGAAGNLIARADDDSFLGYLGTQTTTAVPHDTGLLMFDGNPVRATKIGFDLSIDVLGVNTEMKTFYRTTPRVAAITLLGQPIAFWLTVFPGTDSSQGVTTHQLYGCAVDTTAPANCLSTASIAATGLGGYGIAQQPVAAAAFPGEGAFAIANTDVDGHSWLRLANLSCARTVP